MDKPSPPTRDCILEAAGKLFYAEGFRAISMDVIAEEAGVTNRTLYYHFRSKDDLIAAWLELEPLERWGRRARGGGTPDLAAGGVKGRRPR